MSPFYFTLTASTAFAIGVTLGVFFSEDSARHTLRKIMGTEPQDAKKCVLLRAIAFTFTCSAMLAISGFVILALESVL